MKAWNIENEQSDEGYCTVVFAETRGKAHKIAMGTDCCEDADWNNVRVTRNPKMDAMYRGDSEMDWSDPSDRIALVKECDWYCVEPEYERVCPECPASEWCCKYQDYKLDIAKKPEVFELGISHGEIVYEYECPACGQLLEKGDKYCKCGQAISWTHENGEEETK